MHDLEDPRHELDKQLIESPELLGRECITCRDVLLYRHFRKDASYRDGYRDRCITCEDTPYLSTAEHTHRLREMNNSSHAIKKQRWEHQHEYKNDEARWGRPMDAHAFLAVVKRLVPDLYFVDGRIAGDIAIYRTYGQPQPDLDGRTFRYLFYCPSGILPEFSLYKFDPVRDIPVREKQRGWRTVLLRLIECGLLSETTCDAVFGRPEGPASSVWHRLLYAHRNRSN